jgi:hypothetical protein
MATKHTPGPWKIDESIDYAVSVHAPWSDKVKAGNTPLFGDYRGGIICEMHYNSGVPTKEQALANAKLIAAAPELFEALCYAIKFIELCPKLDEEDKPRGLEKWQGIINKASE